VDRLIVQPLFQTALAYAEHGSEEHKALLCTGLIALPEINSDPIKAICQILHLSSSKGQFRFLWVINIKII